jgi:type I restriction enzyme S subunit
MEKMKDSHCVWIGDIPNTWETKRVKYLATLKGRIGWQGLTSEEYQEEGAFLITGVDFSNGGIDWENCEHVPKNRWEEAKDIQIENGDLLITKDGTIGKVAIVSDMPGETSLNSGVLRIMTYEGYSRRFLYWVLQSDVFWNWFNYKNAGNSTIQHLYQGDFAEFVYAFPKEQEQLAIADFLDNRCSQIDSIIANIEKQIETLIAYKKSRITELVTKGIDRGVKLIESGDAFIGKIPVGWEIKRIKYLISGIKDGTHGTYDRVDEGRYLLSAKNVFFDGIHIGDTESLISDKDYASIVSNGYPQKGDVLLCCVGTVGRTCVYDLDEPEAFQRSVIFLRPNYLIDSEYMCYALQSESTIAQESLLINKTAQDGLYMGAAKEIVIAFPIDRDEQIRIKDFLNKLCRDIDTIISIKEKQLSDVRAHKKSLIYEYVTGKKRVTGYTN